MNDHLPAPAHPAQEPRTPGRRSLTRLMLGAALLGLLAGCGGGDSSRPEDTSAPMSGRDLTKPAQLAGTWMRTTPGDYLGFEFLKDGKVLATLNHVGQTVTLDYSVLDGGRLSLVAPGGGMTTVFKATLDGDRLELAPETGTRSREAQRFRRVASGKTLAVALQEQAAELEAARQQRLNAVQALLAAGDVVIVRGAENGPPVIFALRLDPRGTSVSGEAVIDESPARDDALRPVRRHPVQGTIGPMDEATDRLAIRLEVGAAVAPAGQQDHSGRITLTADGPIERPTIAGTAQFARMWPEPIEVVLKRDASQHRVPGDRFEQQAEARRRAMERVAAPLGGRATLSGTKSGLGGSNPQPVTITVERVGDSDRFQASVSLDGRDPVDANAALGIVIDQGALYVNLPTGEQWRLNLEADGRTYAGPWRPNTRTDFVSSGNVSLELGRVWTAAEVAAERAAIERFLNVELREGRRFAGFVERGRSDDIEYWPVSLEVRTAADGAASGTVWLVGQGVGLELTGRLAGGTLQLNTKGALPGSTNSRTLMQQRWQLAVKSIDPHPRLAGQMSATMGGSGPVELVPLETVTGDAARRALIQAVHDTAFTVVNTTISRKPEPTHFRFRADTTSGAITGEVLGADLTGSRPSALPPGLITGSVAEEHGLTVLKLTVDGSPDPVYTREGKRFEYTVAAHTLGDTVLLSGWDPVGTSINQTWLRFERSGAADAVAVSDDQALRLAAQRLGAVVTAPARPAVGDTVVLLVRTTERDARVGQIFTDGTRYSHGNSVATAALHAGALAVGETGVVRLTYGAPFTAPTPPVERHGVKSSQGTFRPNNAVPTFTIERVPLP